MDNVSDSKPTSNEANTGEWSLVQMFCGQPGQQGRRVKAVTRHDQIDMEMTNINNTI